MVRGFAVKREHDRVIGMRRRRAATGEPEADVSAGHVLWPASRTGGFRARVSANGLVVLVFEFALVLAYKEFFAGALSAPLRPTGAWFDIEAGAGWTALFLFVSLLMMWGAFISAVRQEAHAVLAGFAWTSVAVANLLLVVVVTTGAEQWAAESCGLSSRPLPGHMSLMTAAMLCLVAASGVAALVSRAAWAIAYRRGGRIDGVTPYAVWRGSAAPPALLILAAVFRHCAPHPTGSVCG